MSFDQLVEQDRLWLKRYYPLPRDTHDHLWKKIGVRITVVHRRLYKEEVETVPTWARAVFISGLTEKQKRDVVAAFYRSKPLAEMFYALPMDTPEHEHERNTAMIERLSRIIRRGTTKPRQIMKYMRARKAVERL